MKVIVTGNARSGTSFLTNLVHKMTNYKCGDNIKGKDSNNKWGYWEHIGLNKITTQCLRSVGISYVTKKPVKKIDFSSPKFDSFRKKINTITNNQKIELYKDNKLILAPELYTKLYPEAKWIYIQRNLKDSFKSKFGEKMTFEEYSNMVKNRLDCWESKEKPKNCLVVNYEDFDNNIEGTIKKIINYLDVIDYDIEKLKKVYRKKKER